jgi:hypothetical protein
MPYFLGYGLAVAYTQRTFSLVAYLAHGHFQPHRQQSSNIT